MPNRMNTCKLILSDGATFSGFAPSDARGLFYCGESEPLRAPSVASVGKATRSEVYGEVVFNTGMTGYVESLTDPSYAGQILVFTYPLIGNYGVQDEGVWESEKIHAAGVVVGETYGTEFARWLREQGVPLLAGVDTRALTKHLRSRGTMRGGIIVGRPRTARMKAGEKIFVSIPEPRVYNPQFQKTIILVDCGLKMNILRELMKLPYRIKRVPMAYDYSGENFAGVVLSNGPGDPADYRATIRAARSAMRKGRPVMGICLGSQIMGLAAGAKTYKLKFGHRGHNQPVMEALLRNGKAANAGCYITSQNHGYAVDEKTLPKEWYVNFRNLNDNSVEGIAHKTKPFFSAQFHPEACPGPTDAGFLFRKFNALISRSERKSK